MKGSRLKILIVLFVCISAFLGCKGEKGYPYSELNGIVKVQGMATGSNVIFWIHDVELAGWEKHSFSNDGNYKLILTDGSCDGSDFEAFLEVNSISAQHLTITASYDLYTLQQSIISYQGGDALTVTMNAQSEMVSLFSEVKQYHMDFNNPKPTPTQ